jgi:TrmH family RNA methyltransferase
MIPMNDDRLNDFHIILVEPAYSLNIGATARAMQNLGFRHLHLVAPTQYDPERANATALSARPILETMQFHATFTEAIADMEEVVGLSLRRGRNPAQFGTLTDWTTQLPQVPRRKTGLVFGPEDCGLRQEHLDLCRWIIRIPSAVEYDSFNLAQSALLTLYEITKALPESAPLTAPGVEEARESPTWNDFFQLDRLLDGVMSESGFIRSGSPAPTPDIIKSLLRRASPNRQELGILLGLFGRIHTVLRRWKPDA